MKHFSEFTSNRPNLTLDLKQLSELPHIDLQLKYVKHIRTVVIPNIKPRGGLMAMLFAIEQTLLAAKRYEQSKDKSQIERDCQKILYSFDIALTSLRVQVLETILGRAGSSFTISEIHSLIPKRKAISKPAVTAAMDLYRRRGIILRSGDSKLTKGRGRPEEKFRVHKHLR